MEENKPVYFTSMESPPRAYEDWEEVLIERGDAVKEFGKTIYASTSFPEIMRKLTVFVQQRELKAAERVSDRVHDCAVEDNCEKILPTPHIAGECGHCLMDVASRACAEAARKASELFEPPSEE